MLSITTSVHCNEEPGFAHAVLAGGRVRADPMACARHSVLRSNRCLVGVSTGYAPRPAPHVGAVLALKAAKRVAASAGRPLAGDAVGLDFVTDRLAEYFQELCDGAKPSVPIAATLAVLSIRDGKGTVLNLGDVRVLYIPTTGAPVWV